ncbi:unnamed protein product [Candidula unifasciata]|uniref:Uncharacterized protein n=1 Tax=Candidula unifasciata TaxID=100452 RepID=A0A8S3YUI1_9EUPU|nr:unnamed protein product [Candidula unifasciata]
MNGTGGGGGSRPYPASFTGSQPSRSSNQAAAAGIHAPSYSLSRHSQVPPSESFSGATISSPTHQDKPVPLSTSASYTTPSSRPVPTVHLTSVEDPTLNVENVGHEWERRDSRSSNRSGTSSRFLGVSTGSAWTKWSRERRASYRRRLEKMEQENPKAPTDTARISTPIKKARQEGLKFVHPDLEARYLSEDDINELRRHKQQQVQAMRVIERSRRHKFRLKNELKLTPEQWHLLQEFWNHTFFVRTRFLGIILSFITLIFMIVSITHHSWLKHSEWNSTVVEGLWVNCTQSTVIPNSSQGCTSSHGRNLQNAVIGLLIFSATFGFLASVLSVCGVFTNPLPRKIYYFHSAGEICFICALSASVALIVFPIAVELDDTIHSRQYGVGYGLGWVGTLFFVAAAICMSLDDLVRESSRAKCCQWCWRSHQTNGSELRQV